MIRGFSQLVLILLGVLSLGLIFGGYLIFTSPKLAPFVSQAFPQPGFPTLPPSQVSVVSQAVTPTPTSQVTVGTPFTPGVFKGDLRSLPTSVPPSITPYTGQANQIQIQLTKSAYSLGEKIEVTVTNNTGKQIPYLNGPGCGLTFERKTSTGYQSQQISSSEGSAAPCVTINLAVGDKKMFTVKIDANPPAGSYRASFQYISGTIYSSEFTIS